MRFVPRPRAVAFGKPARVLRRGRGQQLPMCSGQISFKCYRLQKIRAILAKYLCTAIGTQK